MSHNLHFTRCFISHFFRFSNFGCFFCSSASRMLHSLTLNTRINGAAKIRPTHKSARKLNSVYLCRVSVHKKIFSVFSIVPTHTHGNWSVRRHNCVGKFVSYLLRHKLLSHNCAQTHIWLCTDLFLWIYLLCFAFCVLNYAMEWNSICVFSRCQRIAEVHA